MKKQTFFTIGALLVMAVTVAVWAFFQASLASSASSKQDMMPVQDHSSKENMALPAASRNEGVPVPGLPMKVAPIYDANGALVSDPTGTVSNGSHSGAVTVPVTGAAMQVAPVFDSTGAVVSDPTGTLWNAIHLGAATIPVPGAGMKIAPVYDAAGLLVSDPTGTVSNAIHP